VGLTWSEDHTVLAALDRGRLREFSLAGELLLDLETDRVVHHDVFRRDGRTFTLTAHLQEREGTTYIVDGVDAYDPDGSLVFRWDLSEVAEPAGSGGIGAIYWAPMFAGAADWAHANGIHVAEDGDFVLSLHSFSAVVRFTGDPEDPAFGAPEWVLDGGGGSPWPSTFAVVDPAGRTADDTYGHQHHPTLVGDGDLQIFDNGDEPSGEARGLRLALDEEAGTAEIVGSWPIPAICPIEGAVFAQSDGTLLLTCALRSTFYAVDPATAEILGSTTATCADRPTDLAVLPRAIPVDLR
jgi:hypothetical protein